MGLFSNISPEAKQYAKAQKRAKKQWRIYKETGNVKAFDKASYNYGLCEAIGKELSANRTNVRSTNISIGNNNIIKKTKSTSLYFSTSSRKKYNY